MVVTNASDAAPCIINAIDDELQELEGLNSITKRCDKPSSSYAINAVRYKPSELCNEYLDLHYAIKESEEILWPAWWENLNLLDENSVNREKLIAILTQFERNWNVYLASIKAKQHPIELNKTGNEPNHSSLYHTGAKALEPENQEINWVVDMDGIERLTHGPPRLCLYPKMWTVHFRTDYCKLTVVKIRDSYLVPCMIKGISLLHDETIFLIFAYSGYLQVQIAKEDRDKPPIRLMKAPSVSVAWPFDWRMRLGRSREPLTSWWSRSSGYLPFYFRQYFLILAFTRGPYLSCSTRFNVFHRRGSDTETQEEGMFYNLDGISRQCHSPGVLQSRDTNSWRN